MAAYGASKRAVTYFTKALLKDTKGWPVQVGLLSPGIVATDLLVIPGAFPGFEQLAPDSPQAKQFTRAKVEALRRAFNAPRH
jgi:short-subunit dehydrogenase